MSGFEESPKARMDRWRDASEFVVDAFRRTGHVPAEVIVTYDQALYIAARADALNTDPNNVYTAATTGFRESVERARSFSN